MIKVNASARLAQTSIAASNAAEAGKAVLWIQKATGAEGVAKGKAGGNERVEFKIKAGKDNIVLTVSLDIKNNGDKLHIVGGSSATLETWNALEKTGRQTIIEFKSQLRESVAAIQDAGDGETYKATIAVLKKLISAKSKVEA